MSDQDKPAPTGPEKAKPVAQICPYPAIYDQGGCCGCWPCDADAPAGDASTEPAGEKPSMFVEGYLNDLCLAGKHPAQKRAPTPAEPPVSPAGGEDLEGLSARSCHAAWQKFVCEGGTGGNFLTAFNAGWKAAKAALLPAASRPAVGD